MKDLGPLPTVVCRLSVGESKLSDAGSWICELSNAVGKSSSTCVVKVVDTTSDTTETPPSFEELLSNVTATEFTDALLRCKAVGKPEPEVKWFRNDVPVDPSFRHDIKLDSEGYQCLTVNTVESSDEGIYKIRATNSAGWASCDAKLYISAKTEDVETQTVSRRSEYSLVDTIRGRPSDHNMINEADTLLNIMCDSATIKKFLIKWKVDDTELGFPVHLRNKCVVEGSQTVLTCLVNGLSPLKVRWYKGNHEIFDGSKYFIRGNSNILSLEMPLVDLDDTGHYMCVVRNDQGKIFTSCYLQIEPRLETNSTEIPIKPYFTKPMKRQTVNEGELVVFRVAAKARPAPGFKWFKDGQELHENDRLNIETLPHGVGQLTIHMATVRDIGLYVCEVHNHAGRARSMVRLSVRDKYEAAQEAAKKPIEDITVSTEGASETKEQQNGEIKHKSPPYEPQVKTETFPRAPVLDSVLPKTVVIRDRGRFILECCASGYPKPKVTWMRNDQILQDDDRLHFLSMGNWYGLEVLDALPRHEGIYTVKLENSAGFVIASCRVEMKLPKEDPKFFHTEEGELEGFFHKPVLQLLQTEFPWHQFDIPGITPSFHLCNYEADRTEQITGESICLVDSLETPLITNPLPDVVSPYEQDTDLRLGCEIGGKPCPYVVWLKNDDKLQDSERISLVWEPETRTAALLFKSVTLEDSGKYSCIAYSDIGGHAVTSSVVQVRGLDYPDKEKESNKRALPEFKVRLEDKEAIPGEEVRLEVKAEGFPPPEVTWFKNSEQITAEIGKYTISSSVDGVHALVIPDIHLSDSDCFKCEAKNDYGAVSTCAHVKVQDHSEVENSLDTARPYFEEPLHSISVAQGQDAVFKCIAKGNPMPAFKWLRQGVTGIDQNRVKVDITGGETSLTLKNVTQHDAGLYYCFANNKDGTVKSCASLSVTGKNGGEHAASQINNPVVESEKNDLTLFEEDKFKETLAKEKQSDVPDVPDNVQDITKVEAIENTESGDFQNAAPEKDIKESDETAKTVLKSHKAEVTEDTVTDAKQGPDTDTTNGQSTTIQKGTKENEGLGKEGHNKPESQSEKASEIVEVNSENKDAQENKLAKDSSDSKESGTEQESDINTESKMRDIKSEIKEEHVDVHVQYVTDTSVDDTVKAIKDTITDKLNDITDVKQTTSETQNKCSDSESTASNSAGVLVSNQPRTMKLPRFMTQPRSQWVALKSPLEFVFSAEKCEDLTVAWYKDGETLKDDRFQMIWQ